MVLSLIRLDFVRAVFSGREGRGSLEELIQYYFDLMQFLSNLSKLKPKKKCWYDFIYAEVIGFCCNNERKKIQIVKK